MKKIITQSALVIALIVTAGITSCNSKIEFFVNVEEQEICLPAYPTQLSTGHVYSFEYEVAKIKSEFEKQGVTFAENRVNDIKVAAFKIKYQSGAEGSLKELSGAQVYVKKAGESGLGTQVADVAIPEANIAELNFNVSGESLKSFLAEEKIVFTVTIFQRYGSGSKAVCVKLTDGKISIDAKK